MGLLCEPPPQAHPLTRGIDVESVIQDFRNALRSLARSPGFVFAVAATLALGIGANTAIYTVVRHIVFEPLPFLAGDRLVAVWESAPGGNDHNEMSPATFRDIRRTSKTLERVVAHTGSNANISGDNRPERVQAFRVSPDFFEALSIAPIIGRTFRAGEDEIGRNMVVVLSHGLWERRFGGDSAIIGRTITVNGTARQIVGVLPRDVRYPSSAELYVPLAMSEQNWSSRQAHYLLVTGRLAPGATVEQARAEIAGISSRLAQEFPETNARWGSNVRMLVTDLTRQVQPASYVLLAAVAFVLLIACANTANLMLARGVGRQGELMVRAALGATRVRLARRVFAESLLLATLGGVLGIALGVWGVQGLVALVPLEQGQSIPGFSAIRIDGPVLAFTAAITMVTAVLFGLAPAARAARTSDISGMLRAGSLSVLGGRHRLRSILVGAEVFGALLLLVGAGLMVRTFQYLSERDTGVEHGRAALTSIALPFNKYANDTALRSFWSSVVDSLQSMSGVTAAGAANITPMCQCDNTTSFQIDGAPPFAPGEEPDVGDRVVTPDFHRALGIGVVKGRAFAASDRADAPPVVLVNESLERRYFPRGAVGRRIRRGDQSLEIVGVVADYRHQGAIAEPRPELYQSAFQQAPREMVLAVRSAVGNPAELLPAIRRIVNSIDPDLPVYAQTTMQRVANLSIAPVRFGARLMTMLAVMALILATVGIYGVASQLVAERRREIGIRIALGSDRGAVVAFVAWRGLRAVAFGAAGGLIGAAIMSVLVRSRMIGVNSFDFVTYAAVLGVTLFAAIAATVIPARRAARVDPLIALRSE